MSSTPFFSLATYLASRTSDTAGPYKAALSPRPGGTVIWVWATSPDQIETLRGLEALLAVDGDAITLLISLEKVPNALQNQAVQSPVNRAQTETFLDHWTPDIVLWMRGALEPAVLIEIAERDIPCLLVEANREALRPAHGAWVPGLSRAMIQQFTQILAVDDTARKILIRAGAAPHQILTVGTMDTAPPSLPHFEDERQELTKLLRSRPVWLAADTSLAEIDILADAHHFASLKSHRLLLIITPKAEEDGPEMAQRLRDRGYLVALRSMDEDPDDATQVYVADFEGELGLWYRIAPVTYLGNTLTGGGCRCPYEAATLGTAIIHGPQTAPFENEIQRLQESNACVTLRDAAELGPEVERLLAPDVAALLVHGGWEVTSRGAEATGRVAELLVERIDALGG